MSTIKIKFPKNELIKFKFRNQCTQLFKYNSINLINKNNNNINIKFCVLSYMQTKRFIVTDDNLK